jgi:tetratricopeptide (TPR) repeat protein
LTDAFRRAAGYQYFVNAWVFFVMAIPVIGVFSRALRPGRRGFAPIALMAVALGGCSITLGSLSPSSEPKEEPAQLAASANIASLSETIKNNPSNPQAYNMRGSVLAQAGKTEEALSDFNKAISLDPNYGQAFANRGLIYRKTKRLDQAMADYERALALDPSYAPAWLGRGMVYKARNQGPKRFLISIRRSVFAPMMPRPITIVACSIRVKGSTSSRLTISRRQTAWCRNRSSRYWAAP